MVNDVEWSEDIFIWNR